MLLFGFLMLSLYCLYKVALNSVSCGAGGLLAPIKLWFASNGSEKLLIPVIPTGFHASLTGMMSKIFFFILV